MNLHNQKICVLGSIYTIKIEEKQNDLETNIGAVNHINRIIQLSGSWHKDNGYKETLVHEILHCLDHSALGNSLTENEIHTLASVLTAFLRDPRNKSIVKWITEPAIIE